MMTKYHVYVEWISYDKTSVHDGTTAIERDPFARPGDVQTNVYLVDAISEAAAVEKIRQWHPWEVAPTDVYAVAAPPWRPPDGIQIGGSFHAEYWKSGLKNSEALAQEWGVTKRRVQAHISYLNEHAQVGRKIGRDWYLTPEEAEQCRPGPRGRPRKEE